MNRRFLSRILVLAVVAFAAGGLAARAGTCDGGHLGAREWARAISPVPVSL